MEFKWKLLFLISILELTTTVFRNNWDFIKNNLIKFLSLNFILFHYLLVFFSDLSFNWKYSWISHPGPVGARGVGSGAGGSSHPRQDPAVQWLRLHHGDPPQGCGVHPEARSPQPPRGQEGRHPLLAKEVNLW